MNPVTNVEILLYEHVSPTNIEVLPFEPFPLTNVEIIVSHKHLPPTNVEMNFYNNFFVAIYTFLFPKDFPLFSDQETY